MSTGEGTRFRKGQSGNPKGRPKARRPNVSAFDVIIDKVLTVNQGGVERELTVDEALQLQTYQAALKGSRMAIRQVLKMIEKREAALAKKHKPRTAPVTMRISRSSDNAWAAMQILGIAAHDPARDHEGEGRGSRLVLTTWAAQAALSRPGRKKIRQRKLDDLKAFTLDAEKLHVPHGRITDDV